MKVSVRRVFSDVCRVVGMSVFASLFAAFSAFAQSPTLAPTDPAAEVDPFLGADSGGEVFVGSSLPFAMVRPGPDVQDFDGRPYKSGYLSAGRVEGFSHLHLSGGAGKYGNFLLMPTTGDLTVGDLLSARSEESNEPGYYSTTLSRWGVGVEITSTHSVALHRLRFPADKSAHLTLNIDHCLTRSNGPEGQRFLGAEVRAVSNSEIEGVSRWTGGWNEGGEYRIFFVFQVDHPADGLRIWKGRELTAARSMEVKEDLPFGFSLDYAAASARTLQVKVGISFVSIAKARENIGRELPGWDFEAVRAAARAEWNRQLGVIELKGADEKTRHLFYSALYHALLFPSDRTGENPLWKSNEPYYDDYYAIWDTFRTQNPLLTLIAPERERDLVRSLIDIYRHEDYLPDARSGNDTGRTQGGSNADVLIADAFVKGMKGIDYETALDGMKKNAIVEPVDTRKWGRGGLREYENLGYVASDTERSGSRTMEYSYDDFAIAEVACGLDDHELAARMTKRASNWTNLWDSGVTLGKVSGFIRPRNADGSWAAVDTNARGSWPNFLYEDDLWTYSLYAPHDVRRLIAISGGEKTFLQRMWTFFFREHFDMTNEPGFLTPMLFHWVGRPDLSANALIDAINKNFSETRSGFPGNDDSGAMSAWYVFQTMGFYPNAGQDFYLIGAPHLPEVVLHLGEGKDLRIVTENADPQRLNRYIQSATWNGEPLKNNWFRHAMIVQGGTLKFVLGSEPGDWGRTPPPSLSDGAACGSH